MRTIVLSSFPEKQAKPGPHQINMYVCYSWLKYLTQIDLNVLHAMSFLAKDEVVYS